MNRDRIKVISSVIKAISEMPPEDQDRLFDQTTYGLKFSIEGIPSENIFAPSMPGVHRSLDSRCVL